MSSDPRYSAADALAWENYHDAVLAWVNGTAGHPGMPPPGYIESYRLRHPRAPLPSDFPRIEEAWRNRHASGSSSRTTETAPGGVSLSNDAFSSFLNHQALVTQQLAANASQIARRGVRGDMGTYRRASFGEIVDTVSLVIHDLPEDAGKAVRSKGWQRKVVGKAARKNKGKRVPRGKQARIGAVSVAGSETASVASTEDSVDAALFGEEGEAQEVPVVDEDVFMTDYTIFKDEDDDAANGGLLTVDGGEAVNVGA
ncbi:hypothetical protein B0H14DRAFT_3427914 [Mycena olivaceomarginata]|nr:hypothetical protein B0H14DRAFT_3427914 [Mycena olivaceomarginata]